MASYSCFVSHPCLFALCAVTYCPRGFHPTTSTRTPPHMQPNLGLQGLEHACHNGCKLCNSGPSSYRMCVTHHNCSCWPCPLLHLVKWCNKRDTVHANSSNTTQATTIREEGRGGGGAAHPQYANYWAPVTRKRHTMPHSAQPQHTNYWAPRTWKRHQQEHRPQRPTESSDPTQHAKGRTGDRPGPRKGATTRRNVTQGGNVGWPTMFVTH